MGPRGSGLVMRMSGPPAGAPVVTKALGCWGGPAAAGGGPAGAVLVEADGGGPGGGGAGRFGSGVGGGPSRLRHGRLSLGTDRSGIGGGGIGRAGPGGIAAEPVGEPGPEARA